MSDDKKILSVKIKDDASSRSLALFLSKINDPNLASMLLEGSSPDTLNPVIEAVCNVSTQHEIKVQHMIVALYTTASIIANQAGFNKAAAFKLVYDIPWPDKFDADSEKCQGCESFAECKAAVAGNEVENAKEAFKCNAPGPRGPDDERWQ